jgi:nucleotide-binding universal stress UspA family protein
MYDDILVPTDGSESFDTVLDHTIEIATGRDATVHVLYVINDQAFLTLDDEMKDEVIEDLRSEGKNAIQNASETLECADLDVVTAITRGKPADEIVAYADDEQIDIVTMGTQGDDYTENILGSTSETVVAESSIPVLTVNVSDR